MVLSTKFSNSKSDLILLKQVKLSDWLLYMGDIFIGIFAFTVAFWGNRIHRMSWLGSLTIFQAVASLTLIIPELYSKNLKEANLTSGNFLIWTNLFKHALKFYRF